MHILIRFLWLISIMSLSGSISHQSICKLLWLMLRFPFANWCLHSKDGLGRVIWFTLNYGGGLDVCLISVDVCFPQVLFVSKTCFMMHMTGRKYRSVRCKTSIQLKTDSVASPIALGLRKAVLWSLHLMYFRILLTFFFFFWVVKPLEWKAIFCLSPITTGLYTPRLTGWLWQKN